MDFINCYLTNPNLQKLGMSQSLKTSCERIVWKMCKCLKNFSLSFSRPQLANPNNDQSIFNHASCEDGIEFNFLVDGPCDGIDYWFNVCLDFEMESIYIACKVLHNFKFITLKSVNIMQTLNRFALTRFNGRFGSHSLRINQNDGSFKIVNFSYVGGATFRSIINH